MEGTPSIDEILARARSALKANDRAEALRLASEATRSGPAHAGAWFLRGVLEADLGDLAAADASLARAFELDPAQPAANRVVRANVLLDRGDAAGAEREARAALHRDPSSAPAAVTLGHALHGQGRADEALAAFASAAGAHPGYLRAQASLGAALARAGRHDEALRVLAEARARWPGSGELRALAAEAHWRRARAFHEAARVLDAIDEYRAALALDDASPDRWNDLANALADAGSITEAQRAYGEALARAPDYHQLRSNVLVAAHYDAAERHAEIYEAHREWNRRHALPVAPIERRAHARHDRLRVGFMSPSLRGGPTGAFLEPLVTALDRARFRTYCYRTAGSADAVTQHLAAACDEWRESTDLDDDALARAIRDDEIDVLVDLAGHTPGGRLLVLARKPAPVVVTWLDYFDTTGLDAVDYLVGDPVMTPAGGPQRFSEKVLLLDPCRLCFAAPAGAPAVAPAPASRGRPFTFASFNRLSKVGPETIALWSRVLQAVPGSRLLLKSAALADGRMRERIAAAFAAQGIAADRIEMRGHSPHARMLAEYGDVDIALDPFPYNGGLTTCEALWMGVPVLTRLGTSMISRQSASLIAAAGMDGWVARSPDELVRIAAERAGSPEALARERSTMRERLAASPLMDAAAFAAKFGRLLADVAGGTR